MKSKQELNDELDNILEKFANWTIKNVEHGIYIPLPSPETNVAIKQLFREIIGEDDNIFEARISDADVNIRNKFRNTLRNIVE